MIVWVMGVAASLIGLATLFILDPEQIVLELERVMKPNGTLVLSLYRGWASRAAALSQDWYRQQLLPLELTHLHVLPYRRCHDILIASPADGFD